MNNGLTVATGIIITTLCGYWVSEVASGRAELLLGFVMVCFGIVFTIISMLEKEEI